MTELGSEELLTRWNNQLNLQDENRTQYIYSILLKGKKKNQTDLNNRGREVQSCRKDTSFFNVSCQNTDWSTLVLS